MAGKELAQTTYEPTSQKGEFVKMEPKTGYAPSERESALLKHVLQRLQDMRSNRSKIDVDWQLWIKIMESKFYPYADGRARVNVPVCRALVELFVAEATARGIQKEILPVGLSDVDKAEIMKEVWDFEWNKNNRDQQMNDAEYKCAVIGTCAYFAGYEQKSRIISDPKDELDENGKLQYVRKVMRKGSLVLKSVDIRNVYWDDRVTNAEDMDDQIFVEYLTPEQFEAEKSDPNLKNLEYVGTVSKSEQPYFTWEDTGRKNTGYIEKIHYWARQSDTYAVVYNRSIVGRDDPIPYAHKELPIVLRQFGKITDSVCGRGLPEACMQFLDKINRLSEMLFDGLARSNNSVFAIGNGLTFDGSKFSFNNQLLKFNGQLNDQNFREIKGVPPNSAAFEYLQDLLREIAIYVGIDISQIVGQASSTAFETAVRTESSLKRVNVVLQNRDFALQRLFNLHLSNLMQFFPLSEARQICEISDEGVRTGEPAEQKYPKMLLDGKQFVPETGKLVEAPGKFEFEMRPEYIRGQMDVRVNTNFSAPTLKSLKQENLKQFLTDYQLYSAIKAADPEISKVLPVDDFIRELAFTHDVDVSAV